MTSTIPNLPSQYDPTTTEAKWQEYWESQHIFKADPNHSGEPYCIVIPPPNITGRLHMGHAFNNTLIDVLTRYHRMRGRNTLYLPGTDHASIATQTILEKQLREEGKTRDDLGREKFLERAWQWKAESGGAIVNQLRRLGVSVDWTRERFTMDEGLSKAVLEAFVSLYEQGLIYRGQYLVNWCPASQSAVSDLEVEQKEVNGHLWHFRYPLTDGSGFLEVATTRPETMLGDTGVAVNPNDDRYQHLIGKTITLPIMGREIPIIADELVDPAFGTGCVKVTPAHDPNDFEMGKRHHLPFINIMNKDGSLNQNAGSFVGQDRFEARKNVVQRLEADGYLVKIEDYSHSVPYSDRGKVAVEPLISTQWFVKIEALSQPTLKALDEGNLPVFIPDRWTKVYRDWLVKLKDWCISRQLWWGHQIPAWYAVSETGGNITDNTPFVVAKSEAEAKAKAIAQFGENVQLVQDPDVLDTWFSSGLWPFSTLGWPEKTPDLNTYFPTTTLVTGFDIIFFWVARMTMMSQHFMGQIPFKDVYIHGLVLDENGKKMSKSAGNGIDPLLLIDKYGTDALRYTLVKEVAGAGQDIRLEYNRQTDESISVEASRNFCNKLWNASRFVMMYLQGQTPQQLGTPASDRLELCDRWLLSRYHQTIAQTANYIDQYGLGEAAKELYEFIWGDFCDWYIELVKPRLQGEDVASKQVAQQIIAQVLEGILKLMHPFMPHITEEIWQTLTQAEGGKSLATQAYPALQNDLINPQLEQEFELVIGTIRTIRNLRAEADIKPGIKANITLQSDSESERNILNRGQNYLQLLGKVEELTITAALAKEPTQSIASVVGTVQVIMPLAGVIDVAAFKAKMEKKLAKLEGEIKSINGRLSNPKFVDKAPADVVQGAKDALAEAEKQAEILRDRLRGFQQ
ncbi:valine--tRNA ligase [Planktothricoides raciborskii]|uniref:Valine--tRNA ligase n=1 Tax=Planktothricoides raciborskii FACHB-1370 TaxID=2949576 RepID=A0ABR8EDB2_9CYAN|nr:valine--tRNA ligase [Planktothricoides raciborskii]MBD2543586.1 valine--tRNA ligase [Planktothricoides raciborskii FACHB-1370]MBD2581276.1 valine--tRNA ligase [Planktothricoides raciborskii FACHB-1261]